MRTGLLVLLLCSLGFADTNWQNDGLNSIFPSNAGNKVLVGGATAHDGVPLISQGAFSLFDGASHFYSIYSPTLLSDVDMMLPGANALGCLQNDGSGNLTWGTCGGGGGTPGGSSGSVQYNNSGAFGGFGSWDGTNLSFGSLHLNGDGSIGNGASASSYSSTALGDGATATGNVSTALGGSTTAAGGASAAVGWGATAAGTSAFAVGWGAYAGSYSSVAIGSHTGAIGGESIALGNGAYDRGNNNVTIIGAFNSGFTATAPNTMYLGGFNGSDDEAWLTMTHGSSQFQGKIIPGTLSTGSNAGTPVTLCTDSDGAFCACGSCK